MFEKQPNTPVAGLSGMGCSFSRRTKRNKGKPITIVSDFPEFDVDQQYKFEAVLKKSGFYTEREKQEKAVLEACEHIHNGLYLPGIQTGVDEAKQKQFETGLHSLQEIYNHMKETIEFFISQNIDSKTLSQRELTKVLIAMGVESVQNPDHRTMEFLRGVFESKEAKCQVLQNDEEKRNAFVLLVYNQIGKDVAEKETFAELLEDHPEDLDAIVVEESTAGICGGNRKE